MGRDGDILLITEIFKGIPGTQAVAAISTDYLPVCLFVPMLICMFVRMSVQSDKQMML